MLITFQLSIMTNKDKIGLHSSDDSDNYVKRIIEDLDDDGIVCDVCFSADLGSGDDVIVICEGCDAAAHMSCVSLKKVPKSDWFCHYCTAYMANPMTISDRACALCPRRTGILLRTQESLWAHAMCAHWAPLPTINAQQICMEVVDMQGNSKKRVMEDVPVVRGTTLTRYDGSYCRICSMRNVGTLIRCHCCTKQYHPICGRMAGYNMNLVAQIWSTEDEGAVWRSTCLDHYDIKNLLVRQENETGQKVSAPVFDIDFLSLEQETWRAVYSDRRVTMSLLFRRIRQIDQDIEEMKRQIDNHEHTSTPPLKPEPFLTSEDVPLRPDTIHINIHEIPFIWATRMLHRLVRERAYTVYVLQWIRHDFLLDTLEKLFPSLEKNSSEYLDKYQNFVVSKVKRLTEYYTPGKIRASNFPGDDPWFERKGASFARMVLSYLPSKHQKPSAEALKALFGSDWQNQMTLLENTNIELKQEDEDDSYKPMSSMNK